MITKEKNLEEEDSEEDILEEKNFQEKFKNFMENYRKNWVWVSIGGITMSTFFLWYIYFIDIISLLNAILFTIFFPLTVFFVYYARKSKHKFLLNKIMLIGCFGYGITIFKWLFACYILIYAPWAPFYEKLSEISRSVIILILMGAIYGIVAYILYRFGKKREWKIGPFYYG